MEVGVGVGVGFSSADHVTAAGGTGEVAAGYTVLGRSSIIILTSSERAHFGAASKVWF